MEKKLYVVIAFVAVSCIARADNFYTNEASWDAAVSGITTVNFEGIVPTNSYTAYGGTPASTTIGGVTLAAGPSAPSGEALFLIGDSFYGFGKATISAQTASGTIDLQVTLPSSVTAAGFDYFLSPGTYDVSLSDGGSSSFTTTANPIASGFFGVTDPTGFTSLDITIPYSTADESINLSDVSYATANPISPAPEPGSWLLLGTLLGAFGLTIQRQRKQTIR